MTITLPGRPHSKKNSRRVFYAGGRMFIAPSLAYEKWQKLSLEAIREQKPGKCEGLCKMRCDFYIMGKYHVDLDNLVTSVCDILQDSGLIENDDNIIRVEAEKHPGALVWATKIDLESVCSSEICREDMKKKK